METTQITISLHQKKENRTKRYSNYAEDAASVVSDLPHVSYHVTRGHNDEKWNRKGCPPLTHPKHYRQQKLSKYIVYSFIWMARIMYFQIENKQHRGSTPSFFLQPHPHCIFRKDRKKEKKLIAMKDDEFCIVSAEIW